MNTESKKHNRDYIANLVLATSPNMIMVVDSNMRILEFSAAAEKHFRVSKQEALESLHLYDLMDTSDFEWVLERKKVLENLKWNLKNMDFLLICNLSMYQKNMRCFVF